MPASWLPLTALLGDLMPIQSKERDAVGAIVGRHDLCDLQVLGAEAEHAVPLEADDAETR